MVRVSPLPTDHTLVGYITFYFILQLYLEVGFLPHYRISIDVLGLNIELFSAIILIFRIIFEAFIFFFISVLTATLIFKVVLNDPKYVFHY